MVSLWERVCIAFNLPIHPGDWDKWSHSLRVGNQECGYFRGFEGYKEYVAIDPKHLGLINKSLEEGNLMVVEGSSIYIDSNGVVRPKRDTHLDNISNALNSLGINHTLTKDGRDYKFTLFPDSRGTRGVLGGVPRGGPLVSDFALIQRRRPPPPPPPPIKVAGASGAAALVARGADKKGTNRPAFYHPIRYKKLLIDRQKTKTFRPPPSVRPQWPPKSDTQLEREYHGTGG